MQAHNRVCSDRQMDSALSVSYSVVLGCDYKCNLWNIHETRKRCCNKIVTGSPSHSISAAGIASRGRGNGQGEIRLHSNERWWVCERWDDARPNYPYYNTNIFEFIIFLWIILRKKGKFMFCGLNLWCDSLHDFYSYLDLYFRNFRKRMINDIAQKSMFANKSLQNWDRELTTTCPAISAVT